MPLRDARRASEGTGRVRFMRAGRPNINRKPKMRIAISQMRQLRSVALAFLAVASVSTSHAQDQASKIVVGLPAGGSFDTVARIVADKLATETGHLVLVENRPGAQTRIAIQVVKAAPADGNTLLVAPGVAMFLYPHLFRQLGYAPFSDFTPVAQLVSWDLVLAVASDSPIRTFADFLAWSRANPGKAFYGTSGAGSLQHFLGVSLARRTGIALEHVGFKGGKEAVTALIGGHINAIVMDAGEVVPMVQSGKIRTLAIFGPQRERSLPGTPTIRELGLGDLETSGWAGLYAPAKTPPAVVGRLNAAVNKILASPQVGQKLVELGMKPAGGTAQQLDSLAQGELGKWRDIVASSKFVLD